MDQQTNREIDTELQYFNERCAELFRNKCIERFGRLLTPEDINTDDWAEWIVKVLSK